MDVALWILFIAMIFYAWVRVLGIIIERERRDHTKARFDEITKGMFDKDKH